MIVILKLFLGGDNMKDRERRKQELIAKVKLDNKVKEYVTKRNKRNTLPKSVEKFFDEEF